MMPSSPGLWTAVLPFLGGLGLGAMSFAALAWNVGLYTSTGAGLWKGVALHVARLAALAGAFWFAASLGAIPLLAGLAGYLVARTVATRLAGATV